ncbi:MFS transporter [Chloroflexota bacterium]
MKLDELIKRPKRIFYGWWVILAAAFISATGSGFYFYGFSTFFISISKELGLTRAATSTVFALARVEGALEGPLVGWLIDRFGAKKLIVTGLLMFSAGYIAMHWMNSYLIFFVLYAGVIAVGYQTGFVHAKYALANKWFRRHRSKASGMISAAYGIGGAIIVPVLAWLIAQYGWRTAVVVAGAAPLIIGIPLLFVIKSLPEDKGLLPDGEEVVEIKEAEKPIVAASEIDFTVREALKTPTFWILWFALALRTFVVQGIWVHMVPLLVWKGFEEQGAAAAISILLICSIPARLGFGWLGDIYPKRYLLMLCCGIETLALVIVLTAAAMWQVYLFVIIFALGYGVAPLNIAIVGEYYGRKNYTTIRGILALFYAIGTVIGPIFAGYIYDVTQSYQIAFITFIVVYAASGLTFFFARRPKLPARLTGYTTY